MFVADNLEGFRTLFADKLEKMLESESVGAFILVLANSMQDQALRSRLTERLKRSFEKLRAVDPAAPLDDASVFNALKSSGLGKYHTWKRRQMNDWRLNYNPLRALRPPRSSTQAFNGLLQPFNESGFHFNKPFLEPEILWEDEQNLRVLYNKFPFARFHLLVAPEPEANLPQFLTGEHHAAMWRLLEQQSRKLPGLRFAYNSIGAGASVNHLHFQGFIEEPLAVESRHWAHRGGKTLYPASCEFSDNLRGAWKIISNHQKANQPFNTLYSPEGCYVFARKSLGSSPMPDWGKGAAWAEVCGLFTFSDEEAFNQVTCRQIEKFLQSL